MDGIHDMGGMQGWGEVVVREESVFAEPWHGRAFALGALSAGLSGRNSDAFRHAIERQHPLVYLADGYFGRWLAAAETLLVDSSILEPGAVDARARRARGDAVEEPPRGSPRKPAYRSSGPGSMRPGARPPRFETGAHVRTMATPRSGHTRLPRYVRGCVGTVVEIHPCQVLPDTHAHLVGENPQPVYSVQFASTELWGSDAEPFAVIVDCYEDYLEGAE